MTEVADINSLEVLFSKNNLIFGELSDISQFNVQNVSSSSSSFEDTTSFLYDGIDDKLESVSSFTSIDGQTWVGISVWIKIPNVALTNETIIRINNSVSGYSFLVFVRTNGTIDASCVNGSSYTRSNAGSITDNTWHHVFFRFDFSLNRYSVLRIFVDGVLNNLGSNFGSFPSFPSNSSTMFIANNGSTSYANVYVNELAFYTSGDDTLPNEIYNGGLANNLNTDNTYAPLVWYRSENANWNSREWRLTDENSNGIDLISFNMVESNRVDNVPDLYSNKSFIFDGVDDYVSVGTTSLGITSAISVSAWVKIPTSNTGGGGTNIQIIASEDATGGSNRNWNLYWRHLSVSNKFFFFVVWHTDGSNSTIQSTGIVPNDDNWHHLMATFDGTTNANGLKLYVDGILFQTTAGSTGIRSSSIVALSIGANEIGSAWLLEGNIDEVAVFNSALSTTDVTSIYNQGVPNDISSLNPLSWWRMGENVSWNGTNYTLNDLGSGSNNATSVNMSQASRTSDVPLFNNKSFVFDGVDDFIDSSSTYSEMDGATLLTISLWIKPAISGVFGILTSTIRNATINNYQHLVMFDNNDRIRFFKQTGSDYTYSNTNVINIGQWNHVMVCVDLSQSSTSTRGRIFVNNVDETSGIVNLNNTPFDTSIDSLYVGENQNGYLTSFNGNIDEVAIWVGTDLRNDVGTIYNQGVPNNLNENGLTTPTTYYRMGENASWDGTNWTLNDLGSGSNNGTSQNMVFASRTNDVPE